VQQLYLPRWHCKRTLLVPLPFRNAGTELYSALRLTSGGEQERQTSTIASLRYNNYLILRLGEAH
jgi:hypothetical protein